jgi:hypothetical protein
MKTVIIRDDDINYFSNLETLKKLYNTKFFKKFKVCLSIIPNVDSSLELKGTNNPFIRRGYLYEPFIPKNKINTGSYTFKKNKNLSRWISENNSIEPCLHGYSHSVKEFTSQNESMIENIVFAGKNILESSLKRNIKTFVPPHERISKAAWRVLTKNGFYIFRNIIRPIKDIFFSVPFTEYRLSHFGKDFFYGFNGFVKYRNGFEVGCMEPYLFSAFWDMDVSFEYACKKFDESDIFIITNHHWEFDINKDMVKWWNKFVNYMKDYPIRSMTSSESIEFFDGRLK